MADVKCPRCQKKLAEDTPEGLVIVATGVKYTLRPGVKVSVTCRCREPTVLVGKSN